MSVTREYVYGTAACVYVCVCVCERGLYHEVYTSGTASGQMYTYEHAHVVQSLMHGLRVVVCSGQPVAFGCEARSSHLAALRQCT